MIIEEEEEEEAFVNQSQEQDGKHNFVFFKTEGQEHPTVGSALKEGGTRKN